MAFDEQIKKYKPLLLAMILLIIVRCANQIAPPGGEIDTIPPEIVEIFPENGTTNFSENFIEITFSEYIQKTTVHEAIFISPDIEGEIDYSWSGKTLEIEFEDSLKKNTTYMISFGTEISDLNNGNKMKNAYYLTFSTGDKIDVGVVNGKVYDKNPSGIMIFAYKLDSLNINPIVTKPDFISQVGLDGNYKIMGLPYTNYRLFAVRDDYKDLLYNIGEDEFGVPFKDISLNAQDSVFYGLNFLMTRADTIKPALSELTMTDRYHLLLEFNEEILHSQISINNFSIIDSTNSTLYPIKFVYKGTGNAKQVFLAFKDSLDDQNSNYLISFGVQDLSGNLSDTSSTFINVNTKPDTSYPKIKSTLSNYPDGKTDYENPFIEFYFDDAFDVDELMNKIVVSDEKENNYQSEIEKIDDAAFRVLVKSKLKPDKSYKIKFNFIWLTDISGNNIDSLYEHSFNTISDLYFSGLSGEILRDKESNNIVLELNGIDGKTNYTLTAPETDLFNFKRVIPGKYLIWGFIDEDSTGKFSYGEIFPFLPAEKFLFYPDTLNLRARWPVGDLIMDYRSDK